MPAGLSSLPFDILFALSEYLSLEDAVHVALTCRQLSAILKEPTLCRRLIEVCSFRRLDLLCGADERQVSANYSLEANWAREGKPRYGYESALLQIYRRRTALRQGEPYYVQAVAKAETFLYSLGVLCLLANDTITVRRLGAATDTECSISLASLHERLVQFGYRDRYVVKLLSVHEHVLVVSLQAESDLEENYLAALGVGTQCSYELLFIRPLDSIDELFVRQDTTHVYYGTHSGVGDRHHHEWIIRSIALDEPQGPDSDNKVQLEDFVGCEIGSTVDFMVHDGYFYAVSNQTSFTVEEVDWTSFYTVVRFPVGSVSKEDVEVNPDIYRRQHADGPIHDSWTSLSLQHDESSRHLYIVESRREWLEGGSKQTRTFYKQRVWFSPKTDHLGDLSDSADEDVPRAPLMPEDDLFSTVVTSDNNPRYAPRQERSPDQVHPEYGNLHDKAPSFIVAKTKLRSYNLSCSAFVDLVEDTRCCGPAKSCLRLRIGSRQPKPAHPVRRDDHDGTNIFATGKQAVQDLYRYSDIRLWPPAQSLRNASSSATDKAHAAMNPHLQPPDALPAYLGLQVTAVCDERSIVYMVKPARPRCDADRLGTVVFIAFDPTMRRGPKSRGLEAQSSAAGSFTENGAWMREFCGWPGSSTARALL